MPNMLNWVEEDYDTIDNSASFTHIFLKIRIILMYLQVLFVFACVLIAYSHAGVLLEQPLTKIRTIENVPVVRTVQSVKQVPSIRTIPITKTVQRVDEVPVLTKVPVVRNIQVQGQKQIVSSVPVVSSKQIVENRQVVSENLVKSGL